MPKGSENKKFRFSRYGSAEHQHLSMEDLLSGRMPDNAPGAVSQWLGFKDAGKDEVYEGDILELCITEEIMDRRRSTFPGSNLGKKMLERPEVLSCILFMCPPGTGAAGCHYELYFMDYDRSIIRDEDGNAEVQAMGSDSMFPRYMVEKGARVITDAFADTSALYNIIHHTLWSSDPDRMAEYARRYS